MKWSIESSHAPVEIDTDAEWWQAGDKVTHARIRRLLAANLRWGSSGWEIAVGAQRMRAVVHDAPFYVLQVQSDRSSILLRLNDGTEEVLDPDALGISTDHVVYAWIKRGAYLARFKRKAVHQLGDALEERDGVSGLRFGGRFHPLTRITADTPRYRRVGE